MSIIRLRDKIPEVYTNTSRDFQLLTRLYDLVLNGVKFDIDAISQTINTDECNNRLMQLLQTKLGFLSDKYITDDDLRVILKVFPIIVKNKGSRLGVEQSVRTFLRVCGIKSKVKVHIVNNTEKAEQSYIIYIDLAAENVDTTILDEILKYIIPAGYEIRYNFIRELNDLALNIENKIGVNLLIIKDSLNSLIRGAYIQYKDKTENNLIGTVGLTDIIANQCNPEYRGLIITTDPEAIPMFDEEPIRGHVYIFKLVDEQGHFVKLIVKMYDYDDNGQLNWISISDDAGKSLINRYNVFAKAVYGYYHNNSFYYDRTIPTYTKPLTGELPSTDYYVVNVNSSDALTSLKYYWYDKEEEVLQEVDALAFDVISERYWKLKNGTWTYTTFNPTGIKVDTHGTGDISSCYVIPGQDVVVLNCYYNGRHLVAVNGDESTMAMMWESEYINNEYVWSKVILDEEYILSTINDSTKNHVYIEGSPMYAYVNPKMYCDESDIGEQNDKNITEPFMKLQWAPRRKDGTTIFYWAESDFSTIVKIKNSPERYELIPTQNVFLCKNNSYFTCETFSPVYASEDKVSLEPDTIYIDIETAEAYQKDLNGTLQQVLYYNKANNVYSINFDELMQLLDEGAIKPAFKDEQLIFEDSYGNMLLL